MNVHQLDALKKLQASRMGIYEHAGRTGRYIRLRELLTDDELICYCPSGYFGREGQLWYVRLTPPLSPDLGRYWVGMTTPYILVRATKSDWLAYLKRALVQFAGPNQRIRLHKLMKYGPNRHYWNEFILKAYHHCRPDAVFLAGIPDVKASLPHA